MFNITEYKKQVDETSSWLKSQISVCPKIALLTGTGLGESAGSLKQTNKFDYRDIPNFPVSTVEGHHGKLLFGTMHAKPVVVFQGRFHLYEGYSPLEVSFPIRVMKSLGVETLILTNASGGINDAYEMGDIMIIKDHINLTGENPLLGPNEDSWGIRFPDMSCVYDSDLQNIAQKVGNSYGLNIRKGVYAGLKGPSLETPSEIRFLKTIGADAVGLSTIMEVIAAVHAKIRILGLSIITNLANPNNPTKASIQEIIEVATRATPKVERIIDGVIERS